MNYFIADILKKRGIKIWGQLPAGEAEFLKPGSGEIRSYIIVLLPYHTPETERNVARFASFPDYHVLVKGILEGVCADLRKKFPGESFTPTVDSSPIAEVRCAEKCGLGVVGKNGLLINKSYGSYCFLAEIATTMELTPAVTKRQATTCLGCGRCIKACPTGALSKDGFDITKCVSHITQKKGELSQSERDVVVAADYIWGCDRCQEVCPMNSEIEGTTFRCFMDVTPVVTEDMLSDDDFFKASAFVWRGKKIILRNIRLKKEAKNI